ncbi:MAG TPA: LamG domain-containing protein, partial [Saprospiraceae bacterium]|nr:LamG domain-containing protein [Saprospiraceae bacterium]
MRTTYIYILLVCICFFFGKPLYAQNTCGPEDVIDPDSITGTTYFNYGSTSRSKTNTYRTAASVGQVFIGFTETAQYNTTLGFFSRYLLPPFKVNVKATQGELLDRIQVTWTIDALGPSSSGGFNIYRDGIFLATVSTNIRSYNDFNVIAGRPYTYCIRGINIFGEGVESCALGFQVPNGVVTGWISSVNGTAIPGASVMLTPMQGFSAKFEDGDGGLAIADTNGLNPFLPALDQDWTIAFWIKTDTAGNTPGKLIGMPGLFIRSRPNSAGIAVATTAGGTPFISANFIDSTKHDWHHVALTYDGTRNKGRLYFDGVLKATAAMTAVASPDTLKFGEVAGPGLWEGRLDEVRTYHQRLDELDFDQVMEGTASSTTPFLSHYWKMDEELGTKSYDIVNRQQLYFCGGTEFDADRPPVHTAAITNEDGFYMIESASYGTGTTFQAKPHKNFFRHRSLKFDKAENDYAELPDFPITKKATIEVWINNAGPDAFQTILSKKFGTNEFRLILAETTDGLDSEIRIALSNTTQIFGLLGSGFKHLAFTWDSTSRVIKGYRNGVLMNQFTYPVTTGNWSDTTTHWLLGVRPDSSAVYDGLIDEVAFYDTTLSQAKIQSHFQNARDIQERGLRVYFPLDEGGGINLNNVGSHLINGGTTFGAEWSAFAAHQVVEPHIFSPTTRQVTLNPSVTSVDQVDFVDRSTIAVTGYVRYKDTDCFANNVEILVNGGSYIPKVVTDSTGKFVIDFDPGVTAILTPVFEDHVFIPAIWEVTNVSSPIAGILFSDLTTRTITGKVAGGECELPIIEDPLTPQGTECIVRIRSVDGCFEEEIEIDNEAGEFMFEDVPPLDRLEIAIITHSDPDIEKAFEDQGGSVLDISRRDTMLNFIYRAPPEVIIEGDALDFFSPTCQKIVLDQGEIVDLTIRLKEKYLDQYCPLDTAAIHIINGLAEEVGDSTLSDSMLFYRFTVGPPNSVEPYLKTFQIVATTLSGVESTIVKQAIITGIRAKENTFTTLTPEIPTLILRDPPGDGSFSFLEKEEKFCTTTSMVSELTNSIGYEVKALLGFELEVLLAPLGIGIETDLEAEFSIGVDAKVTIKKLSSTSYETCTSYSNKISTSNEDLIVGGKAGGDLYMGNAYNIKFGNVDIVTFDSTNCVGVDSTAVMVEPGDFATSFIYSEFYIKNALLPNLERLYEDPLALPADTIRYGKSIKQWKAMLKYNKDLKGEARYIRNISFDAGSEYEYSETSDTTSKEELEELLNSEVKHETTFKIAISESGFEGALRFTNETSSGGKTETSKSKGVTVGYTLSDNDPLDAFTVDVEMDSVYKTPVFNLRAGHSSCPWEYGTANRQGTSLELDEGAQFVVTNIPADGAGIYKLRMGNVSATNEDMTYVLTAIDANNPDGAVIRVNGAILNGLKKYIIPYDSSQEVTLYIERGPVEYDYDSLLVAAMSECEYEHHLELAIPIDYDPKFFSGLYLGAHFVRPCSEVNISEPEQNWVIKDFNTFEITTSGYDLSEPQFKLVRMQYRKSDGDGTWVNIPGVKEMFNPNWMFYDTFTVKPDTLRPIFTRFFWSTTGLVDGDYEIRALAVCEGDAEDTPGYSQIIKGRIDRLPPHLVGTPEPSDGVFQQGDEISFTFNKPINCSKIFKADILNPRNIGLYNTRTDSLVSFNFTCGVNKVVIDPITLNRYFENDVLRAELHNIQDLTGNKLIEEDWEFYVDRNELAWLSYSAGISKYEDESKSVTVQIHNRGGYPVAFKIQNIPEWVHVTPTVDTLVANEIMDIKFSAGDTLPLGVLTQNIVLRTDPGAFMSGNEELPFSVRTNCRPPDWSVDPSLYQMTMTFVVRAKVGAVFLTDSLDRVGIFHDGECRGTAKLTPGVGTNIWVAYVTVYGNPEDFGDTLTMEIFDASACLRYPASFAAGLPPIFTSNGQQGSSSVPRTLVANGDVVNDVPL